MMCRRRRWMVWLFALVGLCPALWAGSGTVTFHVNVTYDDLGRLATIQHPSGKVQSYTYNSLTGHKTVGYDGQAIVTNTEYGVHARAEVVHLASYGSLPAGTLTYAYDGLTRLVSQTVDVGGVRYQAQNLTYNDWGFLASYTRADPGLNAVISFGHGDRGELRSMAITGIGTASYDYDANANLIARTGIAGSGLELPELIGVSYDPQTNRRNGWIYDGSGKLIQDDKYAYAYNKLERVETVTDLRTGWIVAHYLYDGRGERVREIVDDKVIHAIRAPDGRLISKAIYQTRLDGGMDLTYEDYIYHNGTAICTIRRHPDGSVTRVYRYPDRLGNAAVIADEATGFNFEYREYAPYGHQMNAVAEPDAVAQEFTGHERDEATGWDYLHARYYLPGPGRFNRPDPAFDFNPVNPYSFNLYAYTHNNPVNAVDPNGELIIVPEELKGVVVDAYRESATFREFYDRLHENTNVFIFLKTAHRGDLASDISGKSSFNEVLRNPNNEVVGFNSLITLKKTGGKKELGKVLGHELAHHIEVLDRKKTPDEILKTDRRARRNSTGIETGFPQKIETIIGKELRSSKDDLSLEQMKGIEEKLFIPTSEKRKGQ